MQKNTLHTEVLSLASSAVLAFGVKVKAGEVLLDGAGCFVVQACLKDAAGLALLLRRFTFVGSDGHAAAKIWRDSCEFVIMDTHVPCMSICVCVVVCFGPLFLLNIYNVETLFSRIARKKRKARTTVHKPIYRWSASDSLITLQ
jgi:hypothetical protein